MSKFKIKDTSLKKLETSILKTISDSKLSVNLDKLWPASCVTTTLKITYVISKVSSNKPQRNS
jgi:hypothetical protein